MDLTYFFSYFFFLFLFSLYKKHSNELVGNKAKLQEVLISAEQEKLKISKALVDLQIENNELVERSENDKYELVTKLLNAENEIMESERKEQKKISNVEDLKGKIFFCSFFLFFSFFPYKTPFFF